MHIEKTKRRVGDFRKKSVDWEFLFCAVVPHCLTCTSCMYIYVYVYSDLFTEQLISLSSLAA